MRTKFLLGVAAAAALAPAAHAATGPDSSDPPYVARSEPGVTTTSILTVGDSVGGYRLAGIPDGLGAFDNGDGTFTALANHELRENAGAVRAHGARGAFVSRWTIDTETLDVTHGEDLIQQVATWGGVAHNAPAKGVVISRLCSADLPEPTAWFNPATGLGFDGRIFTSGEETGNEGRAFAHGLDGTSWQLPHLGRFSYENIVAHPGTGDRTVVASTDDSTPGQVYVYAGDKKASGSPVDKAGLTGGELYGVKVQGVANETDAGIADGTPFSLVPLGNVANTTGAQLQSDSEAADVTEFLRPEDGQWDVDDPNTFYFVTTNAFNRPSRLFALRFEDASRPELGGTIDQLLDGDEGGHQMFDNMTVSSRGDVYIQEDPGNQAYLARIWRYNPEADRLVEVAHFRRDFFTAGGEEFLTQDEESSGIIDISSIRGEGKFLLDAQVHKAHPDPELVEYGQLLAMSVPPGRK